MLAILLGRLRWTWRRGLALGLGLLVASTSFALLTADVRQSSLVVRGTVAASAQSAYDILVRPKGSTSGVEASRGLVAPNYLSGSFGGITEAQFESIRRIGGVKVAAPIANIGYVFVQEQLTIDLTNLSSGAPYQLFRITPTWHTDRGSSTFADGDVYVYVTSDKIVENKQTSIADVDPRTGTQRAVCSSFPPLTIGDVFSPATRAALDCLSTTSPNKAYNPVPAGHVQVQISVQIPVLLAAIDPTEEAALDGLPATMSTGRYLTASDSDKVLPAPGDAAPERTVPVIASDRTFADDDLSYGVQRLSVPDPPGLPAQLAASTVQDYVAGLSGPVVATGGTTEQAQWSRFATLDDGGGLTGRNLIQNYWTVAPATYTPRGAALAPTVVTNSPNVVWQNEGGGFLPPIENSDTGFRSITDHQGSNDFHRGVFDSPTVSVVGTYDPSRLAGFSPLSQVPLETFSPPTAAPADPQSARALGGQDLGPNANIAGYIAQPPLLLTTLAALPAFGSAYFTDANSAAPISAIRVRVAGVTGLDATSRERIRRAAQQITTATGLDVDVTYGSSPAPQNIALAAGNHGRPPLLLREGWVKKGVAVALLRGVDRKSAALFLLVLAVCALFVLNATDAAVSERRPELAVLSCLGWSRARLVRLVLVELGAVGLAAGLAGAVIVAVVAATGAVHVPAASLGVVVGVSVLLAMAAGGLPALTVRAARPLEDMRATPRTTRMRARATTLASLALINVTRRPRRTVLGAGAMAIAVFALTTLLAIAEAFRQGATGSLLGGAVISQARPADYAAAALTLLLGAGAVADVIYLAVLERRAELATLAAVGWTDTRIRTLLATEGLLIALTGAIPGAVGGVLVGRLVEHVALPGLILTAAVMTAISLAAAALAVTFPLRRAAHASIRSLLADP